MKCAQCANDFPDELLAPMLTVSGNSAPICGICALEITNKLHGIARSKFDGKVAEKMRLKAIRHLKRKVVCP